MIIKFKLQGIERKITSDSNSFSAVTPISESNKSENALGYYSTLGGAVLKHVKHALIPSSDEEVVELKELVARFEAACDFFRGIHSSDQIPGSSVEIKEVKKPTKNKSNTEPKEESFGDDF